jgi:hypothetical protein
MAEALSHLTGVDRLFQLKTTGARLQDPFFIGLAVFILVSLVAHLLEPLFGDSRTETGQPITFSQQSRAKRAFHNRNMYCGFTSKNAAQLDTGQNARNQPPAIVGPSRRGFDLSPAIGRRIARGQQKAGLSATRRFTHLLKTPNHLTGPPGNAKQTEATPNEKPLDHIGQMVIHRDRTARRLRKNPLPTGGIDYIARRR